MVAKLIILKSPREIERMRTPCKMASEILALLKEQVKPGVTTQELEDIANNGDILSLDFGVLYDDFYGDAAMTVPVGDVSVQATELMDITERSLYEGIA